MPLFDFDNYKEYVRAWVAAQPQGGRGYYQKIAAHLRMHRTTISQIFQGEKHLSPEQASELTDFLGLDRDEALYFITLVQLERAGSAHLKKKLKTLLERLKKSSKSASLRVTVDQELSEVTQARFYSDWRYAGVRVLCSIPGLQTPAAISTRLGLDIAVVNEAAEFLLKEGLCERTANGELHPVPKATYLAPDSPFINSHRRNWRLKALERFSSLRADDLAFSAPLSLSRRDFLEFKARLQKLSEELYAIARRSAPETMAVFNVDWVSLA